MWVRGARIEVHWQPVRIGRFLTGSYYRFSLAGDRKGDGSGCPYVFPLQTHQAMRGRSGTSLHRAVPIFRCSDDLGLDLFLVAYE